MTPGSIVLAAFPLVDTMRKAEAEIAAAMVVRTLHRRGNVWREVMLKEVGSVIGEEIDAGLPPFAELSRNPFVRPDFHELVDRGYAVINGEEGDATITFTDAGIAAMRRWQRPGKL